MAPRQTSTSQKVQFKCHRRALSKTPAKCADYWEKRQLSGTRAAAEELECEKVWGLETECFPRDSGTRIDGGENGFPKIRRSDCGFDEAGLSGRLSRFFGRRH